MRIKGLLLFSFLLTVAIAPAFAQYEGGNNDGVSVAAACVTTLDGVDQFSFGTLTGSSTFCDFSNEGYNVSLNNPPQDIQFYWSGPPGSTVVSGNNTPDANILFGNTPGNVTVTVVTACATQVFNFPVTNGVCTMYGGTVNDGASTGNSCSTMLDGTPLITVAAAIVGSANFCVGSTEGYTMVVDNAPQSTYYNWTVPAGAVVLSGQGTSMAVVAFGATGGNVSVDIITDCGTVSRSMAVSSQTCPFYGGGINDGYSSGPSCSTDLNGAPGFNVIGIEGSTTFCEFGTEGYSANVDNAPANTYYNWSVPAGATIITGQGTANITVAFGATGGNVNVTITTDCATVTPSPLAVTVGACSMYSGSINDGSSSNLRCAINLNGTNALTPGPIAGSVTFCDFATESYSISPQGLNPETVIVWSVPAGSTILSGQGTNQIFVRFASLDGDISVTLTNACYSSSSILPVTSTNCLFYAGGNNDGFSMVQTCASTLNGGDTFIPGPIVGTANPCSFATESYSITVAGALSNAVYNWSVPAGATIISGQGTNTILVGFGATGGNISVDVSNECTTKNASTAVTVGSCIFYAGGNNDGFSMAPICIRNLNGGSMITSSPINGLAAACTFSSEVYSINVTGAIPSTTFTWTVPAGSTIVSGQGTTSVLIAFGNTSGNVVVAIGTECDVTNITLPVTLSQCIFYAGGDNDGFSTTSVCITDLNGTPFTSAGVVGSPTFCHFGTEGYSISIIGATSYVWSVPAGASVVSGQGTSSAVVSFGNTNGTVSVLVSNPCTSLTFNLNVTGSSCVFYAGGNNDGFSVATISNFPLPLPIALVSFDAEVDKGIVYLKWETSSEHENDFFMIEKSDDGKTFTSLVKIDGAGTSNNRLKYQARDTNPYRGTSYYRLSQTDYDGTMEYFKTISVKIEDFYEITKLYPNPVRKDDLIHVDYFAEADEEVQITIIDPAGRGSKSQLTNAKKGVNLFEFTPHFQSAGVHIVIIRSKEKIEALKIVVL